MPTQEILYLPPYPGAGETGLAPAFKQTGFGGEDSIDNFFDDLQFWQDNTEWPHNYRLMDQSAHPARYEHAYWMTVGEKTEMTSEWVKIYNVNYGGISYQISTAGGWTGFYLVRNGRYVPGQVYAGNTTNTDDWSTKYDGMRGFLWDYWTSSNASDQHNFIIAERPTRGSTNFGGITLSVDRNNTSKWRVSVADGNGGATQNYLAGVPDCASDSCALQWEFVKGSHFKFKMYQNVNGSLNFSSFVPPTWPMAETGYYVNVSLAASPLNSMVPITPCIISASSVESGNGRIGRFCYELRGIGNDEWETLV